MRKLLQAALAVAAMAAASTAQAKDEKLVADFVALERAYVAPLFFTNQLPPAPKPSMASFQAFLPAWNAFAKAYAGYRPDQANWGVHFVEMQRAVSDAQYELAQYPAVPLSAVHDALEGVRYALLDLRTSNGFPRWPTDVATEFHDPMEAVALAGKDATKLTPELVAFVAEQLPILDRRWSSMERCPVDFQAWQIDPLAYAKKLQAERDALTALAAAIENPALTLAEFKARTMGIKQAFVPVFTSFANLAPFLPKP